MVTDIFLQPLHISVQLFHIPVEVKSNERIS